MHGQGRPSLELSSGRGPAHLRGTQISSYSLLLLEACQMGDSNLLELHMQPQVLTGTSQPWLLYIKVWGGQWQLPDPSRRTPSVLVTVSLPNLSLVHSQPFFTSPSG